MKRAFALVLVGALAACSSATGGAVDAAGEGSASDGAPDTADSGVDAPEMGDAAPDLPATADGGDAETMSDAAPDGPSACPAEIASCAQVFLALKSQCPGAGVACAEETVPPDMLNRCYANGVRVYFDPGGTTVLKPDGRVCYSTVDVVTSQYVDSTIKDPLGNEVIRITHTLGAMSDYFTCGTDFVEISEDQQPCGDLSSLPTALQCEPGTCERQ